MCKASNHKKQKRLQSSPGQRRKIATGTQAKKVSFSAGQKTFQSALSAPFPAWNELELLVEDYQPDWSYTHRSFIVLNLIRFLELKVLMEEFAKESLLAPTKLVSKVWQCLILETDLYRRVIFDIQRFHRRPEKMIHHSRMRNVGADVYQERLERTQRLFDVYYGETMTESFDDIELHLSLNDTSALTDAFMGWHLSLGRCTPSAFDFDDFGDILPPPRVVSRRQNSKPTDQVEEIKPQQAQPKPRKLKSKSRSKSKPKSSKEKTLKAKNRMHFFKRFFCFDAIKDALFFGDSSEEHSMEATVILEDIEDDYSLQKFSFFSPRIVSLYDEEEAIVTTNPIYSPRIRDTDIDLELEYERENALWNV